jgi:hypothetical protein
MYRDQGKGCCMRETLERPVAVAFCSVVRDIDIDHTQKRHSLIVDPTTTSYRVRVGRGPNKTPMYSLNVACLAYEIAMQVNAAYSREARC